MIRSSVAARVEFRGRMEGHNSVGDFPPRASFSWIKFLGQGTRISGGSAVERRTEFTGVHSKIGRESGDSSRNSRRRGGKGEQAKERVREKGERFGAATRWGTVRGMKKIKKRENRFKERECHA
ncbi:MAG: hypothetical protein D6679_01200 [Candidatus Hydrogenedentota bacterium]|nr:MAG: hypothetical protein D6679_01200 [Candidatus Hydrogenedentota bacterium]